MAHALRSRRGGGGARPAVVPPFRLPAAGHGDARSRLDLRFRQTIDKLGLSAALLAEVNRQLDARGFVIKRGTLVDATIIAGAVRRPYQGGGVNPRDPDARFTRKRDKTYFGYKAHLAVDEGSGLVRQAEMTSANVHDSRFGEALIQGDEQGYFADRAYNSQALRETLERRGLVDGIAWKVKHSRYPLETCQTFHNACHLQLVAVAMNMKRALVIRRAA